MGIDDLKFRLASQYVKPNTAQTEEGKGKKEVKAAETQQPQTKEIGDKLLTNDPSLKGIYGIKLGNVDTSPKATKERIETLYNSVEMVALNKMFGIEDEKPYNIRGVDNDKLNRYLAKGISKDSTDGITNFMDRLVALG